MRPRLVGGGGHCGVQEKQELIGKAPDWRRLPECEPQPYSLVELHAFSAHCLIGEQGHETAAARMRPDIRTQQVPEFQAIAESDLALPDPLNDAVAPAPLV